MGNPNPWPLAWSLTGVCLVTLLGGGAYVMVAMQPAKVTAPTAYSPFSANDKAFRCEYPQGWKSRQGQPQGIESWAEFRSGSARIDINANLQGSLMADVMRAQQTAGDGSGEFGGGGMGGGMPAVPGMEQLPGGGALGPQDRRPPVERLHEAEKEGMEDEYEEYQELPAQPFRSTFGEARLSEFSYKGEGWSGRMKGYRATILGGEKLMTVKCVSTERDWGLLKPAFQRTLNSIAPGGP